MSIEETQDSGTIRLYYHYSALHRTVFAGGAWAGVTPDGLVQLALFNNLRPMPEMVTHGIVNDGIGPEIEKLEKRGVVREVEATLMSPLPLAKSLLPLLQQMIDQLEGLEANRQEQAKKA